MFSQSQSHCSFYNPKPPAYYQNQCGPRNSYGANIYSQYDISDSRTCSDSQSQINFVKKKPVDELGPMLVSVIENTIPRIADHCASVIMQKLGAIVENNEKEMEEISTEILSFRKEIEEGKRFKEKQFGKVGSTVKKEISSLMAENEKGQSAFKDQLIEEIDKIKKNSENTIDSVNTKLTELKSEIQSHNESMEGFVTENINEKKSNVVMLKRRIDEKITPLKEKLMKMSSNKVENIFTHADLGFLREMSSKFDQIYNEINKFSNNRREKHSDLDKKENCPMQMELEYDKNRKPVSRMAQTSILKTKRGNPEVLSNKFF